MICKYIKCVTSERSPKAYARSLSVIYKTAKTSIVLTDFIHQLKLKKSFLVHVLVADQRFNVCFIGLNMHFGFEKNKKEQALFHIAMGL